MIKLSADGYDTDKGINGYLGIYDEKFRSLTNDDIKLLEVGIFKGGSLLMWRDYFKNSIIAGLDCNPITIDDNTGRIHIYRGYQQDPAILDKIRTETAPDGFDIIIDDASHLAELTYYTFWYLFDNHLKPGGIYVIEDWAVGYWGKWPDGKKYYLKLPRDYKTYKVSLIDRAFAFADHISNKYAVSGFLSTTLKKAHHFATKMTRKKQFRSHEYGMVGLLKQLVDELGMSNITTPNKGTVGELRESKFTSMEIFPNLIFIRKNETASFRTIK